MRVTSGNLIRDTFAFGKTYRVAPFNTSFGGYTDVDPNGNLSFTYALEWLTLPSPQGFFLDSATGAMLWQIPHELVNHTAQLMAQHPDTTQAFVYNLTLHFRPADTANTTNGPGGRDCAGGSDQRVDTVEFDGVYACSCPTDTTGPNCDVTASAAASSSSFEESTYAVAAGLVALLLIVVIVARIQIYRARHRPVDLAEMQDEILYALGMASSLSVGPNEIGLTLKFAKSSLSDATQSAVQTGSIDRTHVTEICTSLLAELRMVAGLPPRLTDMLKQSGTGPI